jgi:hypothetical protein
LRVLGAGRKKETMSGHTPGPNVPTFTESYSIACGDSACGNTETAFSNKAEAIDWLLNHLHFAHPELMKMVESAASAACNRHDDPKFGWEKANDSCRQSWCREVVVGVLQAADNERIYWLEKLKAICPGKDTSDGLALARAVLASCFDNDGFPITQSVEKRNAIVIQARALIEKAGAK